MDLADLRVLVVEDHDFQRRVALQLLRSIGVVELAEANDGVVALALLADMDQPPDVVISDVDMPAMDGVEFIRNIAERSLARSVAVTSGLDGSMLHAVESLARAYGLPVLGSIEKPVTAERLIEVLHNFDPTSSALDVGDLATEPELTESTLTEALRNGEFHAHFQPKVDISTGRAVGVEALARWIRPGHGDVLPGAFLPAIERAGLLEELTEQMMVRSCQAHTAWSNDRKPVTLSVNVSVLTLDDVGVADHYAAIVLAHGVAPANVTLEVTETAVMRDLGRSLDVLTRLRLKGFGLSVDDFGTGYASLGKLGDIPFTELKVDRSFVSGADGDQRRRMMVETSLDLARKLRLHTVAEGVESRAEWDLLRELGCEQAQGWFVSKPLPPDDIPTWTHSWRVPDG